MTVKELIDRLSTLPPDAPVVLKMGRNELRNGWEAESVELLMCWRKECGEWVDYEYREPDDWDENATLKTEIVNLT